MAGSSIGRMPDFESGGWRFEPSPASQLARQEFGHDFGQHQGLVTLDRVTCSLNASHSTVLCGGEKGGLVVIVNDTAGTHAAD